MQADQCESRARLSIKSADRHTQSRHWPAIGQALPRAAIKAAVAALLFSDHLCGMQNCLLVSDPSGSLVSICLGDSQTSALQERNEDVLCAGGGSTMSGCWDSRRSPKATDSVAPGLSPPSSRAADKQRIPAST